jgi:hypothetical protein
MAIRNTYTIPFIVALSVVALVTTALPLDSHAGCRWVWDGVDSRWVCDENLPQQEEVSVCDFSSESGRKGKPRTLTVFCRPDGTIWKEIIVRPQVIVARTFAVDGTLVEKRKFRMEDVDRFPDAYPRREPASPTVQRQPSPKPVQQRQHRTKLVKQRKQRPNPKPQWVSQKFKTSVMGIKVRGTVERQANDLRGVVYVYPPFGGKNTYHFKGRIQGNQVVASHHSGHVFRGTIGQGNVSGTLTTKDGNRIPLSLPARLP